MLNRLLLRIKFRIQTEQFRQAALKSKIATVGIDGDDCFMIVVKNRRFDRILNQNVPFGREKQGFLTGAAFCALKFLPPHVFGWVIRSFTVRPITSLADSSPSFSAKPGLL